MAIPIAYNLRNLKVRTTSTVTTALGITLVVMVYLLFLALAHGFEIVLRATGSPQNALVLRRGANAEISSSISREDANLIADAPEVARGPQGEALVSKDLVVVLALDKRGAGSSNVVARGVTPQAYAVRPKLQLVAGRNFTPGLSEVIVGRRIADRFKNCGLGEALSFGQRSWKVVGLFETGGTGFDSEIWGDVEQFLPAFRRTTFQSVTARLRDPALLRAFKARLEKDPRLNLDVEREDRYYAQQSEVLSALIRVLGSVLAFTMAVGAILGAANTMYAAVSTRAKEIGMLRALGFKRRSILASFVLESLLISLVGGLLGAALCLGLSLIPGLLETGTTNWASFSEVAFEFKFSPAVLFQGLVFALVMGLLGGLWPAARAARKPITTSLREG
jgi:ABC-type lipoprotein release transport system permease subunit